MNTEVLELAAPILKADPIIAPGLPAWFTTRQKDAWSRFNELPMPTRRDETWRFSSTKQLDFDAFNYGVGVPEDTGSLIERSVGLAEPTARFIFANDILISLDSKLPEEAICMPLPEALLLHEDLVREHFMVHGTRLGSAKWTALHEAKLSAGMFIYIPDGMQIEGAIEIFHWLAGDRATVLPHTLVVTGSHAKVRVIDYFQSESNSETGLVIAVNDLIAGPGSSLDYVAIQNLNERSKIIQVNETTANTNASAKGFVLNVGAAWVRNETLSRLEGEDSRSDMLSVSVPMGVQEVDQRTFQHHYSPGAFSDLLYKNTLYDKSRTTFSGLIFVDEGSHRTDAYQTCRNLFMSDDAEANSMPGLEINADEVKCSHGSTSSQISDEEIFYLKARGIDPDSARQLIARGFSVEVIHRLENEQIESLVLRFLDKKLSELSTAASR